MKKTLFFLCTITLIPWMTGQAMAADAKTKNPLIAAEHALHQEFIQAIPEDRKIDVYRLHDVWQKAMSDPAYRAKIYMIDVRSDSEWDAFHIEGTDHVQAGHVYLIPKKITDPNAEIYVFCRTSHRSRYVGGFLYKYGYKNVWVVGPTTKNGTKNKGGIVGWAQAGFPFVNQFTGSFKITRYRQHPSKAETSYRLRMWHPY